jgi:hypothetical protein
MMLPCTGAAEHCVVFRLGRPSELRIGDSIVMVGYAGSNNDAPSCEPPPLGEHRKGELLEDERAAERSMRA